MTSFRYHLLNSISITVFAYIIAITINQFILYALAGGQSKNERLLTRTGLRQNLIKTHHFNDYIPILESGFFRIAEETGLDENVTVVDEPDELNLIGTITGPANIARAVIKLKTEQHPEVFPLWSDVYGYTITGISETRVHLRKGERFTVLELYQKNGDELNTSQAPAEIKSYDKSLSRAELKQTTKSNLTKIFNGLHASPHVIDGISKGYKIHTLRTGNPLYKMGLRQGDILKTANGRPVNTSADFMNSLQSLRGDTVMNVEIERNGTLLKVDVTINE